jgi:hypothetical protein
MLKDEITEGDTVMVRYSDRGVAFSVCKPEKPAEPKADELKPVNVKIRDAKVTANAVPQAKPDQPMHKAGHEKEKRKRTGGRGEHRPSSER